MSNQTVTSEIPTDDEIVPTPCGDGLRRKAAGRHLKRKWGFGSGALLAKLAMTPGAGPLFFKPNSTDSIYPIPYLDTWARLKLGDAKTSFVEGDAE